MPPVLTYDPSSPAEQPVGLPSAPRTTLSDNAVLQPPLTRRGTGPGMIMFLPAPVDLNPRIQSKQCLDPEPIQKWAEEGFAVVAVTLAQSGWSLEEALIKGIDALVAAMEVDTKHKFAVMAYDVKLVPTISTAISTDPRLVCFVVYGSNSPSAIPTLLHLPSDNKPDYVFPTTAHGYPVSSPYFAFPQVVEYVPGSAALAHSRSLVFLRKHLDGPIFDLEAIWDEHCLFEFEVRSVAKTMGTMVAEPYVNHVPTMTGGIGRKDLTAFYRDHFIFSNPQDAGMQTVSRTVGPDRVVDEFIYTFTHDRIIDWLLPGIPPTGRKMSIPMMAVVNIRGDRLYNEHIWWDQGTTLRQAGILPTHLPYPTLESGETLRLPVTGAACARMLIDETSEKSNEMLGSDWGAQQKQTW